MTSTPDTTTADGLETWLDRNTDLPRESLFADGRIVGDWQLLALLGRGGSGEVWRARNRVTGETAAVKFLHRTSPEARARFFRECSLLASIHLPGVSRFLASGEVNGIPFLVTEELADYPFPSDDDGVAEFLLELIPALAALHHIGIIHRDIKPSNILGRRDANGRLVPVLIDLGLLKHLVPEGAPAAATTLSIVNDRVVSAGTPGYAAPEQFVGGNLSPATDIHALGMLANHCFRGSPPRGWSAIIRRATSSIPAQRYATVLDLARAIRRHRRGRNLLRVLRRVAALLAAGALSFALVRTLALRDLHALDHVHVSAAAAAPGDGSARRPFATIAEGVRAVNPSGTVTVGPGIYDEHVVLNTKPVHLVAPAGHERTVVRGRWGGSVITVSDLGTDSTITGFTFTGGGGCAYDGEHFATAYGYECYGGGACCSTAAQFIRCRFTGNGNRDATNVLQRTILGGGVMVMGAPVRFVDCLITNNFAQVFGGGVAAYGSGARFDAQGGAIVGNVLGTASGRVGGLVVLTDAAAFLQGVKLVGNEGRQLGSASENMNTAITLRGCTVEGGARANGISTFKADYESRQDYRP